MTNATDPYIVWFDDCDAAATAEVGGKCAGLGELLGAGISVPPGFAVTVRAHHEFLAANGLVEREAGLVGVADFERVDSLVAASEEIQALTHAAQIPAAVAEAVVAAYGELSRRCGVDTAAAAVRSSAAAEDLDTASFAGQLQTYLWIRGADAVLEHVRRCWAGFFTPEAMSYRHRLVLDLGEASMAVGVQAMVDARTAGVMFTLNPLNGDRSKIAMECSWGLGETLVAGEVNPDRFLVDKVTFEIRERTLGDKAIERRFDPKAGALVVVPVEPERRDVPSISDEEIAEVVRQGKAIERHYGHPMDVEWAIDRVTGELRILQGRAETVWSQRTATPVAPAKASALDFVLAEFTGGAAASPEKPETA
jgi:pyruvate,water dikinase